MLLQPAADGRPLTSTGTACARRGPNCWRSTASSSVMVFQPARSQTAARGIWAAGRTLPLPRIALSAADLDEMILAVLQLQIEVLPIL